MRALLGRSLRQAGYDVVECRNGIELLDRIEGYGPSDEPADFDLIISDICMPGVSGLTLLEGLGQWEELQPLRMILITAFGDEQMRERARRFGAAAIFDKPFEVKDLLATVYEVVPPPFRPRRPTPHGSPRVLLAEDDDELRALLAWALRNERFEVTECRGGTELVSRLGSLLLFGEPEDCDLVILDIQLQEVTVLEVLDAMADCEILPPIILITAFGDKDAHRQCAKLGVTALERPFDLENLLVKARTALNRVAGADRDADEPRGGPNERNER